MDKRTRTLLEGDAYELPHVRELLEEYDQQTSTIAAMLTTMRDYDYPLSTSEFSSLGSHASDLACLRATQKQVDELESEKAKLDEKIKRLIDEANQFHDLWSRGVENLKVKTAQYETAFKERAEAEATVFTLKGENTRLKQENENLKKAYQNIRSELAEDGLLQGKLDEAEKRNDMLEDRLSAEINKFCDRTKERDEYRSRALRAESRLESIRDAIGGHLDEKGLRSTQE